MRKILLIFAACTLLLTSCSKNDVSERIGQNDNALKFDIHTGTATRATEVDLDAVAGSNGVIDLSAYYVADNGSNRANDLNFGPLGLTASGDGPYTWTLSGPLRFMPHGGANFYATWPKSAVSLTNTAGTITFPYTIPSVQVDLMGAYAKATTSPNVTLNLRHLLSQINFGVKGYNGAAISIYNISVNGVNSNGIFTFSSTSDGKGAWSVAETPAPANYAYSWNGDGTQAAATIFTPTGWTGTNYTPGVAGNNYIFGDGGNWAVNIGTATGYYYQADKTPAWSNTPSSAGFTKQTNSLMLMPQEFKENDGLTVTFNFTIKDETGAIVDGANNAMGSFTLFETTPAQKWMNNFRYVYLFDFTSFLEDRELKFDVKVDAYPWLNYDNTSAENTTGNGTGIVIPSIDQQSYTNASALATDVQAATTTSTFYFYGDGSTIDPTGYTMTAANPAVIKIVFKGTPPTATASGEWTVSNSTWTFTPTVPIT